ncbi:MAG: hypothetical protein CMJ64_28250 [Planctomycetaceae bacterium]|jgi:hypothetical protein|nr:hypothetical protein [Planctomycetaceae bacterium]
MKDEKGRNSSFHLYPSSFRPLLVFPSYFNRERRDQIDHPRIFGTFRLSGALEELYATLVVKLHHTRIFKPKSCGGMRRILSRKVAKSA